MKRIVAERGQEPVAYRWHKSELEDYLTWTPIKYEAECDKRGAGKEIMHECGFTKQYAYAAPPDLSKQLQDAADRAREECVEMCLSLGIEKTILRYKLVEVAKKIKALIGVPLEDK